MLFWSSPVGGGGGPSTEDCWERSERFAGTTFVSHLRATITDVYILCFTSINLIMYFFSNPLNNLITIVPDRQKDV